MDMLGGFEFPAAAAAICGMKLELLEHGIKQEITTRDLPDRLNWSTLMPSFYEFYRESS